MKNRVRFLTFLLGLVCLLSACSTPQGKGEQPSALPETQPQTTPPDQTPSEDIQMPSYLCDITDTVNLDKVSLTPTFQGSLSAPEDECRQVIQPHFTVDSHMVLQRRAVNLIRGKTTDAHVAVSFGDTLYYGAVTNGAFEVYLPPMEAMENRELVILTDSARLTLTDVCVGEVFLLSGQSNMVWSLAWSEDIHKNEIENATQENIRIMRLNHTESQYELTDPEGDVAWMRVNPEAVKTFSAIGFLFGKRMQEELDVPVGLVQAAVSGSTLAFWLPRDAYNEYVATGKNVYSSASSGNLMPCLGYNGMISPLIGMRFRGMLWYQGEANTQDSDHYFDQLSLLIQTYRENFNAPLMAVTVVELAKATPDHAEKWAPVKAAQQRAAAEIENVALSVSIDLGYHVDVHPRDKTVYAKRAAEITLNKFFGMEIAPFPSVASASRIQDTMVTLTLTGGSAFLLKNGANGFEVSADGLRFIPADQVELDGDTLTILSAEPINYVRYGVIYYDGETDFSKHVTVYNAEGNPLDQFTLKID